jgi:molybdate transport system ATP-binding protein
LIDVTLQKDRGNFVLDCRFSSRGRHVTALFGRSGAGKTSVINMIGGLTRPDAGRIVINDRCVFDAEKRIDVPPEKRRFGYVFQKARLFPHMSVRSNLVYGMRRIRKESRHIRYDDVVDILGISHLLERHPNTLSGGEQQRVAIGRALLTSPEMLLMDEPLSSLDVMRKNEVLPFIHNISEALNIPILYVSHSLDEILNLADSLVLLSDGKVIASGSLEDVVLQPDFQAVSGLGNSGVIISTEVDAHDEEKSLTRLNFGYGFIHVPQIDVPKGKTVRIQIDSRNVGISLAPLPKTSFQNIYNGYVTKVIPSEDGRLVHIVMDIGIPLIATITRAAQNELNIHPKMMVFAMVKSVLVSLGSSFI